MPDIPQDPDVVIDRLVVRGAWAVAANTALPELAQFSVLGRDMRPIAGPVVHAVLRELAANPALAAVALGLEHGVESAINASDSTAQQRDVLRYPWRTTDA